MQRAIQGGSVVLADQKGEAEHQQAYKEDAVQKPRDIVVGAARAWMQAAVCRIED